MQLRGSCIDGRLTSAWNWCSSIEQKSYFRRQFLGALQMDVEGVEPMTSVVDMVMRKRHDEISDGNKAEDVTANAPMSEDHFFMVPKVVE